MSSPPAVPYRYYLVATSLGCHKVLPDRRVVLLCPTTVRAQTHYFAEHYCHLVRLGLQDRQPSEQHRRFVCRLARERGLIIRSTPLPNDPWNS